MLIESFRPLLVAAKQNLVQCRDVLRHVHAQQANCTNLGGTEANNGNNSRPPAFVTLVVPIL